MVTCSHHCRLNHVFCTFCRERVHILRILWLSKVVIWLNVLVVLRRLGLSVDDTSLTLFMFLCCIQRFPLITLRSTINTNHYCSESLKFLLFVECRRYECKCR
jgi:hypothetical protein